MSGFAKIIEEVSLKDKILLTATKKIEPGDIEYDPIWRFMSSEYEENQNSVWLTKATVGFMNSMFYQKRIVFALTRDSLHKLLKSDSNWKKEIGLKASNYSLFLAHMFKNKIVKEIQYEAVGRKVMVLQLIHPDLLKFFQVDVEAQMKQTIDFAKREGEFSKKAEIDSSIFDNQELLKALDISVKLNKPSEHNRMCKLYEDDFEAGSALMRELCLEEYSSNKELYKEFV